MITKERIRQVLGKTEYSDMLQTLYKLCPYQRNTDHSSVWKRLCNLTEMLMFKDVITTREAAQILFGVDIGD